jgi:hypothetical protein
VIDPEDPPRRWTVDEADAALPDVRPLVARAKAAATGIRSNGHDPAAVVRSVVHELQGMGILLRDPARGLVDFPARASSGRPFWLCWLDGEPAVQWWHWVEDGFAGRTPVTDLP